MKAFQKVWPLHNSDFLGIQCKFDTSLIGHAKLRKHSSHLKEVTCNSGRNDAILASASMGIQRSSSEEFSLLDTLTGGEEECASNAIFRCFVKLAT